MSRFKKSSFFIFSLILFISFKLVSAAAIKLDGTTVTKDGISIGGALIKLAGKSLQTTSTPDGKWSLSDESTVIRENSILKQSAAHSIWDGTHLLITLQSAQQVSVSVYNTKGVLIDNVVDKMFLPGHFKIRPDVSRYGSQLLIMQMVIGSQKYTSSFISKLGSYTPGTFTWISDEPQKRAKMSAISTIIDTLVVSKSGYQTKKIPIDSYAKTIPVTLYEEGADLVVKNKNMAIIQEFAGTNCQYCGTWGMETVEGAMTNYHGKTAAVVIVYSRNGSAFNSKLAKDWENNFAPLTGHPLFKVNGAGKYTNYTSMKRPIDMFVAQSAVANTALKKTLIGGKLEIDAKVEFFQDVSGVYHLGVYLLEDGPEAYQAGQNKVVTHHNVLRASADGASFGEQIGTGVIKKGETFTKSYSVVLDSEWNSSAIEVIAVIFEKVNSKYQFVNVTVE